MDITEPGYIYVFVSYSNESGGYVYFDDLQVTHHERLSVVQADDYYPFGMTMSGLEYRRGDIQDNDYLYQGKEFNAELDLNWYDFHARMFDPGLGRWMVADPADQFASPYIGMGNMPTMAVDPDGRYSRIGALLRSGFCFSCISNPTGAPKGWGFFEKTGKFDEFTMLDGSVESIPDMFFNDGLSKYAYLPKISNWEPNLFQSWGMSNNFWASTSYSIVDGPWGTLQFFTPWRKATHLDGQQVVGDEGTEAFMNTALTAIPTSKLIKMTKGLVAVKPLTKVSPFKLQITHGLTKSKSAFAKLKADIKVNGIKEPIKFVKHKGIRYVVDGHHRLRAAKELGIQNVPVQQVKLPYAGYRTIDDLFYSPY